MRRYFNLDLGILQLDGAFPQAIDKIEGRRNDSGALEIACVRSGSSTHINIGASPSMKLTVKKVGEYDANPIIENVAFTQVISGDTIYYVANVLNASGSLDKLLGVDNVTQSEVTNIQCVADIAGSLAGRYFDIFESATSAMRVWFKVSGVGVAPAAPAGGRLLGFVAIANNDTAATIAAALQTAIAADAAFTATVSTSIVTATVKAQIPVADPSAGSSGFSLAVLTAGATAGIVVDVASVTLMAEISLVYQGGRQTCQQFEYVIDNNMDRSTAALPLTALGVRSGNAAIGNGVSYVAVVFAFVFPSANWFPRGMCVRNTVDGSALNISPGTMTAKSAAGFTVQLSGNTDSANYILDYVCDISA